MSYKNFQTIGTKPMALVLHKFAWSTKPLPLHRIRGWAKGGLHDPNKQSQQSNRHSVSSRGERFQNQFFALSPRCNLAYYCGEIGNLGLSLPSLTSLLSSGVWGRKPSLLRAGDITTLSCRQKNEPKAPNTKNKQITQKLRSNPKLPLSMRNLINDPISNLKCHIVHIKMEPKTGKKTAQFQKKNASLEKVKVAQPYKDFCNKMKKGGNRDQIL